jgi:hypothetical protein
MCRHQHFIEGFLGTALLWWRVQDRVKSSEEKFSSFKLWSFVLSHCVVLYVPAYVLERPILILRV